MPDSSKYLKHSTIGFFVWPAQDEIHHIHMGRLVEGLAKGSIISAGFITWRDGRPYCHGRSETLNLDSHEDDTTELRKTWGIK